MATLQKAQSGFSPENGRGASPPPLERPESGQSGKIWMEFIPSQKGKKREEKWILKNWYSLYRVIQGPVQSSATQYMRSKKGTHLGKSIAGWPPVKAEV